MAVVILDWRRAAWLLVGLLVSVPLWADAPPPTIRLFPTTVLEDIRETGEAAREMETGLQEIIGRLDEQQKLVNASKCEGAEADPGCEQLLRGLGRTYLEMLEAMAERLPAMEEAVNGTRGGLERRLRAELGHKLTPWDLQELLLGQKQANGQTRAAPARSRGGSRLSDRFRQYYRLVAQSGRNPSRSLAVVAADMYLDMQEAGELIARTREEINRARLMEQLNQDLGLVTPQMQEVVAGVKGLLFGEQQAEAPASAPPDPLAAQSQRSPLEL